MPAALTAAASGLALGLSLIVVIGAQNAFVLRQGIRREHVPVVVAICAGSDAVLIALGVAGAGALFALVPWLLPVIRYIGAAFLVGYAVLALRRAIRPRGGLRADARAGAPLSLRAAALACLAITWLNPHVYLDTLALIGSVAATHGSLRWAFGAGAILGSVLWFSVLGFGARLLAPLFSRPLAWRILDVAIAVVMLVLATILVLGR